MPYGPGELQVENALENLSFPDCVPEVVFEIVFWLLWFNSCMNPLLYSFVIDAFRQVSVSAQ
jgi:hypothetical protein